MEHVNNIGGNMKVIDAAAEFIKGFEGFSATPYKCPAGKWTNGYGETLGITQFTAPVTKAEAQVKLKNRLREFARKLDAMIDVDLTDNQATAILSLVYNIGLGNFKTSTLRRKLNKGDIEGAAKEFLRWKYADGKVLAGLVTRRKKEQELFLTEEI